MNYNIVLSHAKKVFENVSESQSTEVTVDCPRCARIHNDGITDGKGNLSLNPQNGKYKCWKCEYAGTLHYLFKRYADPATYISFNDEYENADLIDEFLGIFEDTQVTKIDKQLPPGFIPFAEMDYSNEEHLEAYRYVTENRKLTHRHLIYYRMGFCLWGKYEHRIVVPSFDPDGKLNFFSSRTYREGVKPSYMNPYWDKMEIIFNHSRINWNIPVFLVEGAFDMIYPNSIPLLGKVAGKKLLEKLSLFRPPLVYITLDPDAMDKAEAIADTISHLGLEVKVIDFSDRDMDVNDIHKLGGRALLTEYMFKASKNLDRIFI